jgi:protein tyrosine phosphatase
MENTQNTNNDKKQKNEEDNKKLIIPSLIPNLEKNDYSYHNLKKIINDSVIKIERKKDKGKIHISDEKKIKDDYNILKNFTDYDNDHYNLLDNEPKYSRYSDISTYHYNHVKLKSNKYINASYIDFPTKEFFIATQGPLPNTISDFWDMVWEKNVNYIVMLCELTEGGRTKCSEYWNPNLNNKYNIEIKEKQDDKYLIKREINFWKKKDNNKIKKVIQLHFKGWPDHGVPDVEDVFNTFMKMINEIEIKSEKPVVVHCSAGVGRTGTFITLYNIIDEIKKQINNDVIVINIFNLVRKLKEMRLFLVENISQYEFIHHFIKLYCEQKVF